MSAVELPTVTGPAAAPPPKITRERYARLARRVKLLSWLSLAWMTVEGAAAIVAGIVAGSIALIGFGLDSAIEGLASVIIIWRFTASRVFSQAAEQRAQKLVAVQFFILAPYVGFEATRALVASEIAEVSWVGIGLAIGSVIFMPMLGIAKQRLADQIGSAATAGEGRQNMLCAYLAGALLVGLLGNALVGAWWLDPIVGLLIAAVAVREGVEAWRGEGCCVSSPLDGARFADEGDAAAIRAAFVPELALGAQSDLRGDDPDRVRAGAAGAELDRRHGVRGATRGRASQVRVVEEPYLLRVQGDRYATHAASAGRFVPGIGDAQGRC